MTSLGVWSCQWRELRPISFGGHGGQKGDQQDNDGPGEGGDDGVGYGVGRGRGRARDGTGGYEMVEMKDGDDAV